MAGERGQGDRCATAGARVRARECKAWIVAAALLAACAPASTSAEPAADAPAADVPPATGAPGAHGGRFFLSGDGVLAIENAHTREKVLVTYRTAGGAYSPEALRKLDELFRSRGDDERTRVSLRLVELIDFLEDHEKPRTLFLISGYRSEGYNSAIIARGGQAARASMHTEGLAADLRFEGVDHRALWDRLRARECCGAGYYKKSGFVHVDTGRPRFWEEGTSKVKENLSKGNARVIARTDFDRYDDLLGLETSLHAITLRPLRVSTRARLVGEGGGELATLTLAGTGGAAAGADGCITLDGDQGHTGDVLRVAAVEPRDGAGRKAHGAERARVVLTTCEPRLEATPPRIESNLVEPSAAALHATHRASAGG